MHVVLWFDGVMCCWLAWCGCVVLWCVCFFLYVVCCGVALYGLMACVVVMCIWCDDVCWCVIVCGVVCCHVVVWCDMV